MMGLSWPIVLAAFWTVFLAELGDKTQLAVFALATAKQRPLSVAVGAGAALLLSTAAAVALGAVIHRYLPEGAMRAVHYAAGAVFIAVGIWTILRAG